MTAALALQKGFNATPVIDFQVIIAPTQPPAPPSYETSTIDGVWIARDARLPLIDLRDRDGRQIGLLTGFVYSEFRDCFLTQGVETLPVSVRNEADLEALVLPRLSGMYLLITSGSLPKRVYPDHAGSLSLVYSASDGRAASSPSLLLNPVDYEKRFRPDLHRDLVVREGSGGWISGTLTAHRDVYRLLPNHFLDIATWTTHRYWPRPGDFATWRDMSSAAESAARALTAFSNAGCDAFRVAATLTAGFDSRLLVASCHERLATCQFFTIETEAKIDVEMSQVIAKRFGLLHQVVPLRMANADQMAIWDRVVGDCMIEAPRLTHPTLGDLTKADAVYTGMYGEVGRCRLYRQDLAAINQAKIDARFVIDRLTLPPHPELVENIGVWLQGLAGQPNSVILDLAFHELKFGVWAMGQRPMTNSIKLNLLPIAQRKVLDAFIGVAPAEKGTEALFSAIIDRLWPDLLQVPINKFGDFRDYLVIWEKISNPNRVRRFLRDRLARKS